MPTEIARRIERELRCPGLADALARLPASDLQSLLMEVHRTRAERVNDATVARRAATDPLVQTSSLSARELGAFDSVAFQAARDFTAAELSPVCPFAAESALGGTSQNNVLTSTRNAEVLGDPTIALALEACRRRQASQVVRLCSSHRVIRLQPFDVPGYSPHFRLFAMVTAGRDVGGFQFETEALAEHVRVYLRIFRALAAEGFVFEDIAVEFTDMDAVVAGLAAAGISREEVRRNVRAHKLGGSESFLREQGLEAAVNGPHPLLEISVIEPLRDEFTDVRFRVNRARLEGLGYYCGFAMRISSRAADGNSYPLVDGGYTDWTARLLSNRKERLLVSGMGTEFICKTYKSHGT